MRLTTEGRRWSGGFFILSFFNFVLCQVMYFLYYQLFFLDEYHTWDTFWVSLLKKKHSQWKNQCLWIPTLKFFSVNTLTAFAGALPRLALITGAPRLVFTCSVSVFPLARHTCICSTVGDESFRSSRHRLKCDDRIGELLSYMGGYVCRKNPIRTTGPGCVCDPRVSSEGNAMHAEHVHSPTDEIHSSGAPFCHLVHARAPFYL